MYILGCEDERCQVAIRPLLAQHARSLVDKRKAGLWRMPEEGALLCGMLNYRLENRITAEIALDIELLVISKISSKSAPP